jgi:hypothetical protein
MLCSNSNVKSKFWRQPETTGPKTSSAVGRQGAVPGSMRDWLDIFEGFDADEGRRREGGGKRRRESEVRKRKRILR